MTVRNTEAHWLSFHDVLVFTFQLGNHVMVCSLNQRPLPEHRAGTEGGGRLELGGSCTIRSNVSWVMFTWGPPRGQTD